MNFGKYFPISDWLPNYKKTDLKGDLSAGLTVGVMLIPQGMAYSMLAGLPPIYGLYASAIPLILYAILGTSRQLAVGPVAMVALLIATGVSELAEPGSAAYIQYAILLAMMVGVIQFAMGVSRLGFLVNFLSHPVISGFTSAAALIIGLSQLKHLLGIDIPRSHFIHEILNNAFIQAGDIHIPTLILGLAGIALILGLKKTKKSIPGSLVAVIFGIIAVSVLNLDASGMAIVKDVPGGFPSPSVPVFSLTILTDLLPMALTISLIGFMESIAVAKAIQAKHKNYEVDSNQELIGLGIANIGGAFFQSFPVTGGFSRTAVNDQAGARTGMASMISAFLIILTLLFLTPLFYYLPKAILASVIMVAVVGLIDIKEAKHLWKTDKRDFIMLLVAFIGTLTLGIEQGIALGVILSLAFIIYKSAYPHIARLGKIRGTGEYMNVARFPEAIQRDEILIVRYDAQLFFANTAFFRDQMMRFEKGKGDKLKLIILVGNAINSLDSTAVHVIHDMVEDYKKRGIIFSLSGLTGPVRDILNKSGLMEAIGRDHFFLRIEDAINAFDNIHFADDHRIESKAAVQTND